MSAYEDIGLSYVSLNESTYGKMQFANPIGASEAFVVVVKAKANGNPAENNPKILTIGIASSTLGSGGLSIEAAASDGRATTNHYAQTVTSQAYVTSVSGTSKKLNDGEDHIFIVSIPAGAGNMLMWADAESKTYTKSVATGFSSSLLGITINGRVNNASWDAAPQEKGIWNISWLAIYSSLDSNGRAALFSGASPLTVGTLRSGDSFWAFDGNPLEYNGGTPFTFTGSPTFVQPAYRNVLDVTESYLSLSDTQYAQAPISSPIGVSEYVWWARKFRITGGTSDPYLATLGKVAGGQSAVRISWLNSNNKIDIYRIENGSVAGTYSNAFTVADGQDHIVVMNIKPSWVDIWIDGAAKITGVTGTALSKVMDVLTINARWDGTTTSRKGSQRVYWEYLYNTLSPADIAALMQGEHPASVGNVRQGYNLLGDGSEVNGGPALTLYGDPDFYVPRRNGLTFPLTSSLVSSLTSPLVSR